MIIALGEGVLGTIASLSALVGPEGPGWSLDAGLVVVAGIGLTFGMWWIYFIVPCAEILHVRRDRSFGWGRVMATAARVVTRSRCSAAQSAR